MITKFFKDSEIEDHIPLIMEIRLEEFKKFPGLYVGKKEWEIDYLKDYAEHKNGILAMMYDGDNIVGISTGIPFLSSIKNFHYAKEIFTDNGFVPSEFYYYGETFIKPEYRGQGLFKKIVCRKRKIR